MEKPRKRWRAASRSVRIASAASAATSPDPEDQVRLAERVVYYGVIFQKEVAESDGIWSRFGVLSGINLGVFAAFGYVALRTPSHDAMAFALSVGGLFHSVWSYITMVDLWRWHNQWVAVLKEIERSFPASETGWRRAFDGSPNSPFDGLTGSVWWASTQLILLLYAVGWLALIVWQLWFREATSVFSTP